MSPSPPKVMSKTLQIAKLKEWFGRLNPLVGVDIVDWMHEVDETLTLPENRLELSIQFPQYHWFFDEDERGQVKQQAYEELGDQLDYMLAIIPEENQKQFRDVFEDYLSRVRYSLERKLSLSQYKQRINRLQTELEEAHVARGEFERRIAERTREIEEKPEEIGLALLNYLVKVKEIGRVH